MRTTVNLLDGGHIHKWFAYEDSRLNISGGSVALSTVAYDRVQGKHDRAVPHIVIDRNRVPAQLVTTRKVLDTSLVTKQTLARGVQQDDRLPLLVSRTLAVAASAPSLRLRDGADHAILVAARTHRVKRPLAPVSHVRDDVPRTAQDVQWIHNSPFR